MRRGERLFIYGGLMVSLVAALGGRLPLPSASAASPHRDEPPAARIAVCDVYQITDRLVESDRYMPRLMEERERILAELAPLENEIRAMQERGMAMDPESEDARTLFVEFQKKQQEYFEKQQQAQAALAAFLATLYVEAYEEVRASTDAVAEELGYTHVIVSRRRDEKIDTTNINQVIQAVLARPVAKAPEGSDITDDVMKDLKL